MQVHYLTHTHIFFFRFTYRFYSTVEASIAKVQQ